MIKLEKRSTQLDKKVVLITGVSSQDGAYIAGFILQKGGMLRCVKRWYSLFKMARIDRQSKRQF